MFQLTPGRFAVALIVALAVSLAAFNVWFHHATTSRIHARWGTAAMDQIAHAPRAWWCEIGPSTSNGDDAAAGRRENETPEPPPAIELDGRRYDVLRAGDLVAARGAKNLRYALGQDASYAWDDAAEAAPPDASWRWMIVFSPSNAEPAEDRAANNMAAMLAANTDNAVLLFDLQRRLARTRTDAEPVRLSVQTAEGLKTFFAEQTALPNGASHASQTVRGNPQP